jgi:hypothetical protein
MISDRITAFCGNNCIINFRGAARKGTDNVFTKLKSCNFKMNTEGIRCTGCESHISHNPASADILPIDVTVTVNIIFQYFHIYIHNE